MAVATEEPGRVVTGDELRGGPPPDEGKQPRADVPPEQLALPLIDGKAIDKIRVSFSGSVMLDRHAPADVELYRKLVLGESVTIQAEAKVAGKLTSFTTNKEGDLDSVVGDAKLKVETVYVTTLGL